MAAGWSMWGSFCEICGRDNRPHLALGACGRCYVRVKNNVRRRASATHLTRQTLASPSVALVADATGATDYLLTPVGPGCEEAALAILRRMVPLARGQSLRLVPWESVPSCRPSDYFEQRGREDYAAGKAPEDCPYGNSGRARQYALRWRRGYLAAQQE